MDFTQVCHSHDPCWLFMAFTQRHCDGSNPCTIPPCTGQKKRSSLAPVCNVLRVRNPKWRSAAVMQEKCDLVTGYDRSGWRIGEKCVKKKQISPFENKLYTRSREFSSARNDLHHIHKSLFSVSLHIQTQPDTSPCLKGQRANKFKPITRLNKRSIIFFDRKELLFQPNGHKPNVWKIPHERYVRKIY